METTDWFLYKVSARPFSELYFFWISVLILNDLSYVSLKSEQFKSLTPVFQIKFEMTFDL